MCQTGEGQCATNGHYPSPWRGRRHKFVDRHAYMCLTARTLAMTEKEVCSSSASGTCVKGQGEAVAN